MNSQEIRVEDNELEWDDDVTVHEGSPFTGIAFRNYPNGSCEYEFRYVNGFREGIQREFFDNADMKEEWVAERGAAVGEVRKWHKNRQLKSVGNFEYGAELQYDEWDATGTLIESRRIDRDSQLMKYVETMRERASM